MAESKVKQQSVCVAANDAKAYNFSKLHLETGKKNPRTLIKTKSLI